MSFKVSFTRARTVQWLLSRSASVVHRDHEGMTAIHWAALKGHEQEPIQIREVYDTK